MVQARGESPSVAGPRGEEGARWHWRRTVVGVLVALGLAMAAGGAETDPAATCEAWPGEPSPLPRIDARDPLLARWAALRVRELSAAALDQQNDAPALAHRLWERVLCLQPGNREALEGMAQTPAVAIHRPLLVARGEPSQAGDPWADLGEPLAVLPPPRRAMTAVEVPASLAPASAEAPAPPPDPMGDAIASVQDHLRGARFEDALTRAERGRRELAGEASPGRIAELEVLAATAALALDRKDEAAESLRRALAANPMLTLDPMQTPPKVRRAFDRVRAGASL